MNKTLTSLLLLGSLISASANAEGFKVDASYMDTIKHFDILTIGSLAVGETGLLSKYDLGTCVDKRNLMIASSAILENSPDDYLVIYNVTRKPGDKITITLSDKGKKPKIKDVQDAITWVSRSSLCDDYKKLGVPLLSVDEFLGAKSLKQLLSNQNTNPVKTKTPKTANTDLSKNLGLLNEWITRESKSPIDDSPRVFMTLKAEYTKQELTLRCQENKTEAYVVANEYLGSKRNTATVRYGNNKAKDEKFSVSTDKKALFFSKAIPTIKTMMKHESMIFRYTVYDGSSRTVTFLLGDLKNQIQPLRAACNW